MHTLNRFLTMLLCLAVIIPPATFAFVSTGDRDHAKELLQEAIGSAVRTYTQRSTLIALIGKGEKMQKEGGETLPQLTKQKLEIRRKIVEQKGVLEYVSQKYGVALRSSGAIATLVAQEKVRLSAIIRGRYISDLEHPNTPRDVIVQNVLHLAASDTQATPEEVEAVHQKFLEDLVAAQNSYERLGSLTKEREAILADYWAAQHKVDKGQTMVVQSDARLDDVQRITADVHAQVLRIQGELARIDSQLRTKAQRALIEKGLLDPKDLDKNKVSAGAPQFHWPAYGGIAAGFLDAAYKQHFGVPHYGIDISIPQGSPVYAAADGVVFLVRDGGDTGYSYILIGHRGGYATLYGHVSLAVVGVGQEVAAGQQIALSGGTPGTHGAGPMTTAAHLHFEVIQNGTNINPRSVLP
jgi:murein DD-endopeptidase MepM/ murein hydrolase activator NlpD